METPYPLRKGLETSMIRAYLKLSTPSTCPNLLNLLPNDRRFPQEPGYTEFLDAFQYEYSRGDYESARLKYESACSLGHPLANYCYALWYLYGGDRGDHPGVVEKDLRKAFRMFCVAHKSGLGAATYQLADYYRTGKGRVVERDEKKAFDFLINSIEDSRIHFALDHTPFVVLGLCYGLGRGTPNGESNLTASVHVLNRAIQYEFFRRNLSFVDSDQQQQQQENGNDRSETDEERLVETMLTNSMMAAKSPSSTSGTTTAELSSIYQVATFLMQWDGDEVKRQVNARLDSMERKLIQLPPGRAMMSVRQFADLAKTEFGVDFDDYLAQLDKEGGGGGGKKTASTRRMAWKSFRRMCDGRGRPLPYYEVKDDVEGMFPLVPPNDTELAGYLREIEGRFTVAHLEHTQFGGVEQSDIDEVTDDDYGFRIYDSENGYGGESSGYSSKDGDQSGGGNTVEDSSDDTGANLTGASDYAHRESMLSLETGDAQSTSSKNQLDSDLDSSGFVVIDKDGIDSGQTPQVEEAQ